MLCVFLFFLTPKKFGVFLFFYTFVLNTMYMNTSFDTYFDLNLAQLRIQDTSSYDNPSDYIGILEINSPIGLIYQNSSYLSPDISPNTSVFSSYINLPKDVNGFVRFGNYIITYSVKQISTGTISVQANTYNYNFIIPELDINQVSNGYLSEFDSLDDTDYGTYLTLNRTHTVTPPVGSGLVVTTGSQQSIHYGQNIWSGFWNSSITSILTYNVNGLHINITLSDSIDVYVYYIKMDVIRTYIEALRLYFITSLNINRAIADGLENKLLLVDTAYAGYNIALNYNNYLAAYEQAVNIVYQLNDYITITGTEEIIPFYIATVSEPSLGNPAEDGYVLISSSNGIREWVKLAIVAFSGEYNDLLNKPTLALVATSGSYSDLSNKPTIPDAQVQTDWDATSGMAVLLHKPTLALVATSGSYSDLSNKPTIPDAQVQTDWDATSGMAVLLHKPTLALVATSGSYSDLSNKPTIPDLTTSNVTFDTSGKNDAFTLSKFVATKSGHTICISFLMSSTIGDTNARKLGVLAEHPTDTIYFGGNYVHNMNEPCSGYILADGTIYIVSNKGESEIMVFSTSFNN
jgi:hypothetical protein